MNITEQKQTHRCREQTSGYQWGEGGGKGQYRSWKFFFKWVIMGLYEIMCVKLLKIVKHYRIQRIIQLIKEEEGRGRGKESMKVSVYSSLQTHSHKVSSANVFQRKPQSLQALILSVSGVDHRKQTIPVSPVLTPHTNHTASSALLTSLNKAKWELLPALRSTDDVIGSLQEGPSVTRSNLGT